MTGRSLKMNPWRTRAVRRQRPTARDVRAAFNEVCSSFPFEDYLSEATFHEVYAAIEGLKTLCSRFEGMRILDLGSGAMEKPAVFRKLGFDCYAIDDLQDPWHQRGNHRAEIKQFAAMNGINFHLGSFETAESSFPNASFDVVSSFNTIEHLHGSPRALLNAMGHLARPNGLILLVMPNAVNLRKRLDVLRGRTNYVNISQYFHQIGEWRGHVREFTLNEMRYICESTGFHVVHCRAFETLAFDKLGSLLRQFYLAITSLLPTLRTSLLVIAQKPVTWTPLEGNEETSRRTLAGAIPEGVR